MDFFFIFRRILFTMNTFYYILNTFLRLPNFLLSYMKEFAFTVVLIMITILKSDKFGKIIWNSRNSNILIIGSFSIQLSLSMLNS